MSLKTRWFGKKIKGEALESLVGVLGENPDKLLQTSGNRWSTSEVHGRVSFTPTKEGVNVDLYVFREDYHIKDGTILADKYGDRVLSFSNIDKEILTHPFEAHIKGEIKYNKTN